MRDLNEAFEKRERAERELTEANTALYKALTELIIQILGISTHTKPLRLKSSELNALCTEIRRVYPKFTLGDVMTVLGRMSELGMFAAQKEAKGLF